MKNILAYLDFLKNKGRLLSEINPGSDEIALEVNDALYALELLKNNQIAILGGDILSENDEGLIYAYQLWGAEYHYLNWYCNRKNYDSQNDFLKDSYMIAKKGIKSASDVAEELNKKCFIAFVI